MEYNYLDNNECLLCSKRYTSHQGLLNHNKKYHLTIDNQLSISTKNKRCSYCKRLFANNYTVKRHELKCMYKNDAQIDKKGRIFFYIKNF